MKLLLVEDDRDISNAIVRILKANKYDIDTAYDGIQGLQKIHEDQYDAIILDVMMPRMDGVTMIKKLRAEGNATPTLMLTAKSQVEDKVEGLDAGADDYLPKPFAVPELLARIRAITRRGGNELTESYHIGNLTLDHDNFELKAGKASVRLTDTEYRLMEYLIRHKNVTLSTERIMEDVWGWDTNAEINVVWAYLSALRKKLGQINADVTIKAMRGVGYKLVKVDEEQ